MKAQLRSKRTSHGVSTSDLCVSVILGGVPELVRNPPPTKVSDPPRKGRIAVVVVDVVNAVWKK